MKFGLFTVCFSLINFAIAQIDSVKINGISLVSEKEYLSQEHINPLASINANYVSVIPYAFVPNKHEPQIAYDFDGQWRGERLYGIYKAVHLLKEEGFKVMIKPQLWVGHKEYAGFIKMKSEQDWQVFEHNYREYIMAFVELAVKEEVELFCIGTEVSKFANLRPLFWEQLIKDIRAVYSGRLTYAANWDNYDRISFWKQLDLIGIDAYFPVTKKRKASLLDLKKGWKKLERMLRAFSFNQNVPIIFTEYGYRSVGNSTNKPWDYEGEGEVDERAQARALKALYEVMWGQDYFFGGFLWKWYPDHENLDVDEDDSYIIQHKRAEKIVREHYQKR